MKTIAQLIFFLITVYFVGYVTSRVIFRRTETTRVEETVLAFGFGLGMTPLLMFYLAFTGARLSPLHLAFLLGPFVLLSATLWYRQADASQRAKHHLPLPFSALEKGLLALIVGAVVAAFVLTLSKPLDVWDAVTTWGFKAEILYHEQTIYTESFLENDGVLTRIRPRPQYALGLPLLEHLVAVFLGGFDEARLKIVSALFFALLILAMYTSGRVWFSRQQALVGCAVLCSIPCIYYQTVFRILLVGGKKSAVLGGMADLPLACFLFLSVTSLFRWFTRPEPAYLISAAFFAAFAGFTKSEGIALSVITVGTLGLFTLAQRRPRVWSSPITFVLIWLVLLGPWLWFRQELPLEPALERVEWNGQVILRTIRNIPMVARFFLQDTIDITSWGLIWILWVVLSLLKWRQILSTSLKYLYLIVLSGLGTSLLVVAFAPISHIERSFFESRALTRLLFQLVPLVIFLSLHLLVRVGEEPTPHTANSDSFPQAPAHSVGS